MSEHLACSSDTYICAHCKLVSIGSPVQTVVLDNQELAMCCLGCVYAAEMLLCLHDADTQLRSS